MLFVSRIDVAAEAVRSPEEIGRMLREAVGQIGALTEVIGGTCVVSNLCPAKFACIGCSGNAPDPERRHQIETKRTWAIEQITWARREHLPAEERQMTRVVQNCGLLLEPLRKKKKAETAMRGVGPSKRCLTHPSRRTQSSVTSGRMRPARNTGQPNRWRRSASTVSPAKQLCPAIYGRNRAWTAESRKCTTVV